MVNNHALNNRAGSRRIARSNWGEWLLHPRNGMRIFCTTLFVVYAAIPVLVYLTFDQQETLLRLAVITLLGLAGILLGSQITMFDRRLTNRAPRLVISPKVFVAITWCVFLLFVIVTFATAPTIPVLSAFGGVDSDFLSQERGDFLKGREGAGLALLYISTFLVNTVVPYTILLLYLRSSRWRHLAAAVFFLFCISFLQKSLFLNLVLPLMALFATKGQLRGAKTIGWITFSLAVLIGSTYLSVAGSGVRLGQINQYLSALYSPSSPLDYFFWRLFAVPIFTATDSLLVYAQQFQSTPLLGATSSFISFLFDMQRVNLERFVFEHQFGSWNDIANANAVFLIDGYVNFGWGGVLLFGMVVGLVFRLFRRSKDPAFQALWPLFAFVLFSAPLIGMLLSNGFLYMILHALFIRVAPRRETVRYV